MFSRLWHATQKQEKLRMLGRKRRAAKRPRKWSAALTLSAGRLRVVAAACTAKAATKVALRVTAARALCTDML